MNFEEAGVGSMLAQALRKMFQPTLAADDTERTPWNKGPTFSTSTLSNETSGPKARRTGAPLADQPDSFGANGGPRGKKKTGLALRTRPDAHKCFQGTL